MNNNNSQGNGNKPKLAGVGWLSEDKTYIKLRLNLETGPLELIVKKSRLTEKKTAGQADYLVYPKPEYKPEEMDF